MGCVMRPKPLLWLRYAFIGSLPPQYSEWVLHDVTTGTWVLRHIVRVLTMLLVPEVVLVVVLPAPASIRIMTAFVTGACVLLLMCILVNEVTERIVQRAGYAWGTAQRVRCRRAEEAQRVQAAAYRARVARRHAS